MKVIVFDKLKNELAEKSSGRDDKKLSEEEGIHEGQVHEFILTSCWAPQYKQRADLNQQILSHSSHLTNWNDIVLVILRWTLRTINYSRDGLQ